MHPMPPLRSADTSTLTNSYPVVGRLPVREHVHHHTYYKRRLRSKLRKTEQSTQVSNAVDTTHLHCPTGLGQVGHAVRPLTDTRRCKSPGILQQAFPDRTRGPVQAL